MLRLPEYLKTGIAQADNPMNKKIRNILNEYHLNTVCDSARCPNKKECYCSGTATFMIMGNTCTRNCKFCNIDTQLPAPLNKDEPENIAKAVSELNLNYCVITSVTRDDLDDGGASHFASTIKQIKKVNPKITVEVLTPDFKGSKDALNIVLDARPDIFNHNIETVKRLYPVAREMADYEQSLFVLDYAKRQMPELVTKTGIMTGLGETREELVETFRNIASVDTDILTIGQYIRPSKKHLEVVKYYEPEEFEELRARALQVNIRSCIAAPLVRSSYMAKKAYDEIIRLRRVD